MSASTTQHDLQAQLKALQLCLTADKRPLGFFLGAGCPSAIQVDVAGGTQKLIPNIEGLTALVCQKLNAMAEHKPVLVSLNALCKEDAIAEPTVEDYLNRLRNIKAVGGKEAVRGITPDAAALTDKDICKNIAAEVGKSLPDQSSPYHALARWIRGIPRIAPVEIFTPNYDLLFEQSFEESGVSFFDGFAGTRRAFLDIEAMDKYPPDKDSLPPRWARLWKLHGSINWHRDPDRKDNKERKVWRGQDPGDGELLIYPSHDKYMESRQMPFLAMLDRLKAFLARPEAVLVVCGYSFVDRHFNACLRDGLRGNSRAVVFGLVYGNLSTSHPAIPLAEEAPNFLLVASNAAVIGGNYGTWGTSAPAPAAPPDFTLGDFASLGKFLSSISGQQTSTS